jgi:hypothetical protein
VEWPVGEAGQVYALLWGSEEMSAGLYAKVQAGSQAGSQVGALFCLTEGRRIVVTGVIHEFMDHAPDEQMLSPRRVV